VGTHGLGRPTQGPDGRREVLDAVRRLVRGLRISAGDAERRTGLSMAQFFVLQKLAEASDLSIAELASRTFTDPSSVSVVVARLVRTGLVVRGRDPRDARRARLALTRRGRRLLARAPCAGQEVLKIGRAHV
jgi:DNA-binding MarR family transcriptional regulator